MYFETRTLFLELFTKELIKNSYGKGFEVKIDIEKLKKEYEEGIKKIGVLQEKELQVSHQIVPDFSKTKNRQMAQQVSLIKPEMQMPQKQIIKKPTRVQGMFLTDLYKEKVEKKIPKQEILKPNTQIQVKIPTPKKDFSFSKIKQILSDPKVMKLECPGPNKFILVKTATKIMNSGIKMNEREIKEVINYFSTETRIPLIGGLFKAVKDNLLISAVTSEIAGSRFIIKKLGPAYSTN